MFHQARNQAVRRNSQRRLAALVAKEMATAMQQLQAAQPPPVAQILPAEPNGPRYNIKSFTGCNPPKYSGSDGATTLLQWFEGIESVFSISECPTPLHVKYAASMFTKRALTWWNKEKMTRGMEAAHAMPWTDLKTLMLAEFCPRNEVKKLESEFWDLKQIGGNNDEYTTRFHELSLLVPRMVTPSSVAIEKYLDGLPPKIRDNVLSSKPSNLEEAVRLAASLTDNLVKDGELIRVSGKKKKAEGESSKSSKSGNKKHKVDSTAKNYAITALPSNQVAPPQPQPHYQPQPYYQPQPNTQLQPHNQAQLYNQAQPKKVYTGPHPLCNTCGYHHPAGSFCRLCTKCNRYGHLVATCRMSAAPLPAPTPRGPVQQNQRRCFACGDPNHFIRECPRNPPPPAPVPAPPAPQQQPPARGRAYVLNANQAQVDNEAEV